MESYRNFLWAAAPYILLFFAFLGLVIIILKVILHHREKKLTSKPQDTSRFDDELLKLDEEDPPNVGI